MTFGSPESRADIPRFLESVIGHPPTAHHVADLTRRYRAVGGSPLVPPVLFTAHSLPRRLCGTAIYLEVLYDIDLEARSVAAHQGWRLHRTASLNGNPRLIRALARSVRQAVAELP